VGLAGEPSKPACHRSHRPRTRPAQRERPKTRTGDTFIAEDGASISMDAAPIDTGRASISMDRAPISIGRAAISIGRAPIFIAGSAVSMAERCRATEIAPIPVRGATVAPPAPRSPSRSWRHSEAEFRRHPAGKAPCTIRSRRRAYAHRAELLACEKIAAYRQ
jgi:hypothetical protein